LSGGFEVTETGRRMAFAIVIW